MAGRIKKRITRHFGRCPSISFPSLNLIPFVVKTTDLMYGLMNPKLLPREWGGESKALGSSAELKWIRFTSDKNTWTALESSDDSTWLIIQLFISRVNTASYNERSVKQPEKFGSDRWRKAHPRWTVSVQILGFPCASHGRSATSHGGDARHTEDFLFVCFLSRWRPFLHLQTPCQIARALKQYLSCISLD